MEKENVLEIESQEVFDKVAVRIKYQNEDVLPRGDFEDKDLRISSKCCFAYYDTTKPIYLLGANKNKDSQIIILGKEEFKDLEERVNKLNKKYGIPKRWRAEELDEYYYIDSSGIVWSAVEKYCLEDNGSYELGNYFKTEEEAQKAINSKEWQDFWAKVRAGEIGGEE